MSAACCCRRQKRGAGVGNGDGLDCLHAVADVLLDKENIDGDEFEKIMLAAKAKLYLKDDNESVEVPFKTA